MSKLVKQKHASLFICGCCGEDTRKTDKDIKKVILSCRSNMLCRICRSLLEDDIDNIARKYLDKSWILLTFIERFQKWLVCGNMIVRVMFGGRIAKKAMGLMETAMSWGGLRMDFPLLSEKEYIVLFVNVKLQKNILIKPKQNTSQLKCPEGNKPWEPLKHFCKPLSRVG